MKTIIAYCQQASGHVLLFVPIKSSSRLNQLPQAKASAAKPKRAPQVTPPIGRSIDVQQREHNPNSEVIGCEAVHLRARHPSQTSCDLEQKDTKSQQLRNPNLNA